MAEYRRGQGPDALPQGAATGLNAATPRQSQFDQLALESPEIPVEFVPGNRGMELPETDDDLDEDLQILAAGPDPGYQRTMFKEQPGRVPKYVVRHLPQLRAAATQPDAPPALLALYRATLRRLEDERRRKQGA